MLRPISRLGGITFGRTTQLMELPRPDFEKYSAGSEKNGKKDNWSKKDMANGVEDE